MPSDGTRPRRRGGVGLLLAGLWAGAAGAAAPRITVRIGQIEGPAWQATDVTLTHAGASAFEVNVATARWAGRPAVTGLRMACATRRTEAGLRCEQGRFGASVPQWGRQAGTFSGIFSARERWRARLAVPRRGLVATLDQAGAVLNVSARMRDQPAEALRALAAAFGARLPGTFAGTADLTVNAATAPAASTATLEVRTTALGYQEPTGRYAAENLALDGVLRWNGATRRWTVSAAGRSGQAYAEPVFVDFSALPTRARLVVVEREDHWDIERLRIDPGTAGTLEATARIAKTRPLLARADVTVDAADLAPLFAAGVAPFLIGTGVNARVSAGAAHGTLAVRAGAPTAMSATLTDVALTASRPALALDGVSGTLNWAGAAAPSSSLRWNGGALGRVPFGPSAVSFRAQARDFELLSPWRQPLLGGALRARHLALRGIGGAQLDADFRGALEPIDLAALCTALDWPVFGGRLGGQVPGIAVRDGVWSLDGTLQAQVFDGTVRLENLQAIEPFGVLARVAADVRLRRLDLEPLTGAFDFGRITGRLDGDITGLRVLGWEPVAFDARLYSTPGDASRRRISQRAIDNISAIGGGPTGVLSRGFLRLFEDFSYDRMGIGCRLRDGTCRMDGIAPARGADGGDGYYLVRGRLLPRIDVVGHAHEVAWDTLLAQLRAALLSGGPRTQP